MSIRLRLLQWWIRLQVAVMVRRDRARGVRQTWIGFHDGNAALLHRGLRPLSEEEVDNACRGYEAEMQRMRALVN